MPTHHKSQFIKKAVAVALLLVSSLQMMAYEPRVHCEEDTIAVGKLLVAISQNGGSLGDRIVFAANQLVDKPWEAPLDNDSIGTIVISMHGFDRLGFVNTVLALAHAGGKNLPLVRDFENYYEGHSRRKGEDDGFASQLIYGSDWIVDNVYRGNIKDMTEYLSGGGSKTKTLDYITRHRSDYPALKNEDVYDKVRMMELGYRSHRIPHLKKQSVGNKELHELLRNGDLIMMLSPEMDFDLYDIGVVEMKDGVPYLIHISHENGKVVADPYPLPRLFKLENQHFYGYRWLRPQE